MQKRKYCIIVFLLLFIISVSTVGKIYAQDTATLPAGSDMTKYIFADTSGKEVTFKEFKGKYIYVDIWASWCHPCINAFPALDSLKQKLKNKNIVFIQLSCDAQIRRWMMGIYMYHRSGEQIFMKNKDFMKDLKVAYIPRYILIDRDGKLLNANMTSATDTATEKNILELSNI